MSGVRETIDEVGDNPGLGAVAVAGTWEEFLDSEVGDAEAEGEAEVAGRARGTPTPGCDTWLQLVVLSSWALDLD